MAKLLRMIMPMSLALCAVLLPLNANAQKATHPLSKDTVLKFLKGDVSPHRVAGIARERGIDFQVTPEVERELRQAGATDELIRTLRMLPPGLARPAPSLDSSIEALLHQGAYSDASARLKTLLATEPRNAEAHYLLAKTRCLSVVRIKRDHPDGIVAGFPAAICGELKDYLSLAPNGKHSKKAQEVFGILRCDLAGVWPAQPRDALELQNRRDYERDAARQLGLVEWEK